MALPNTRALSQHSYTGFVSNIYFLIGFRVMSTCVIFLYYFTIVKAFSVIEVEICTEKRGLFESHVASEH